MASGLENIETVESPFRRFVTTIGVFPTAFTDAMTYYECLAYLVKYMEDTMIPAINENAEAVEELQGLYIQLKAYVDNYFENLDVQEEINNKLDQMVEDGKLQEIITTYIQANVAWTFNTVADMKNTTNLVDGSYAKTLGFYSLNDGGGALYKITNTGTANEHDVIALSDNLLAEYVIEKGQVSIKQFGAKGDGTTDDTGAIQATVNYAFEKKIDVLVNGTADYYKVTLPIIINVNSDNGYWQGNANKIVGEIQGNCRIIKIGDAVHTSSGNVNVNNKNATFICANTGVSGQNGVGIYLDNISLENFSDSTLTTKTSGSLGLWTNVPRSTYKNLNINAYYGIYAETFSCSYENIVFICTEKALNLSKGTSNTFRFLYAPGCKDPYSIVSSYSSLISVCCDNGRGTLFTLGGMGLSLIDCGCESINAQYIFKIANNYTTLAINNFYMHRQIGDPDNNIALEDCAVLYSQHQCVVDIDNFSVAEFSQLDTDTHNSYFFMPVGNGATALATSLKNLRYYKNYQGTANKRMLLWSSYPSRQCAQRYSTPTATFNYSVTDDLKIYPFIGGYYGDNLPYESMGGSINENNISSTKTLWLDCKTKYTTANDSNIRYTAQHHVGDVQFYNDPLAMNALGLSVTEYVNSYTWNGTEIPLVLRGATTERPTTNLYIGLCWFDTTLGKPVWYNGSNWVDATGTAA